MGEIARGTKRQPLGREGPSVPREQGSGPTAVPSLHLPPSLVAALLPLPLESGLPVSRMCVLLLRAAGPLEAIGEGTTAALDSSSRHLLGLTMFSIVATF